jgi:hypothetical protein
MRDSHVQQAKFNDRLPMRMAQHRSWTGGLFLWLPWVRERGSGRCEKLLRSLGRKVLSWARGPLGRAFWEQAVVSLRCILLVQEGGGKRAASVYRVYRKE